LPSFIFARDQSSESSVIDPQEKDWRSDKRHLKHTGKRLLREGQSRLLVVFWCIFVAHSHFDIGGEIKN
jgi:hypothetical protein